MRYGGVCEHNRRLPDLLQSLLDWYTRHLPSNPQQRLAWLELFVVIGFCWFLFYYGLGSFGLVGADEPRYAQIAREMLERHDFITPTLHGVAWLEKPALYYWRAMLAYELFGVHDWAARLPSATFASLMVLIIYFHMRRFRPGAQLDAALITASAAAVIGFARGASTDMQLAAPFTIAMLGWYAWYETGRKFWLFDLYFFLGVGTLAKGPVAPFLAGLVILAFAWVKRDWKSALRTLWIPGILAYLAMVLPWFIAVQVKNPQFLYVFILEHNLERFATDMFRHVQPFWYYLPVLLLSLVPWTFFSIPAVVDAVRSCIQDWRTDDPEQRIHQDSFPEFLVVWAFLPIVFFSLSRSKLPGYILPAIAPFTILTADYLRRRRGERISRIVIAPHAALCGALFGVFLLFPYLLPTSPAAPPSAKGIAATAAGIIFIGIYIVLRRTGMRYLRMVTLVPVILILAYVLRIAAPSIDDFYSSRPVEAALERLGTGSAPVAVFQVKRELLYGLGYYRNQAIPNYDEHEIPAQGHVLVARNGYSLPRMELGDRRVTQIGDFPPQKLIFYWVGAKPVQPPHESPPGK